MRVFGSRRPLFPSSFRALMGAALFITIVPAASSGQFVDAYFDAVRTPAEPGQYPPDIQTAIDEGYEQLSLVAGLDDEVRLEAAKRAFETALELDPRAIHAWNGKGIYELTKDEGWLTLLESIKKLFNRDHISMAIGAFERALAIDPHFAPARMNLGLALRQTRNRHDLKRAADMFRRVATENPEYEDAMLMLMLTYRDMGDLDKLEDALDEIAEDSNASRAGIQLMLAYALANKGNGRPVEAAAAYEAGLDAIATQRDADVFWLDIRPVASADRHLEYERTPIENKDDFIRAYWQQLADRAFVSPEERLVEHYRRLHFAYENYRISLPERRHYSAITAFIPKWQSGFDDRGLIYLRHGPPDDIATYQAPELERNVSWKYDLAGQESLIFHFVSDQDNQDFKLIRRLSDAVIQSSSSLQGQTLFNRAAGQRGRGTVDANDARILAGQANSMRDLYRSRGHLDPDYDRVGMSLDQQILDEEEAHLARDIAIGTLTESFEPEPPENPLIYPVHPVPFRGRDGRPVLAVYYAVPTLGLTILPQGSGSALDYRYQLRVNRTDNPDVTLARADQEIRIATPSPIPQAPGVMLPGVEELAVDPGDYSYGMKVTDLNSGRFGVLQGTVSVDDFSTDALTMSGIVLATSVAPANGSTSRFVRWEQFKVLPLPSHMFRREQPVFVYYELYDLTPGSDGGLRYRTRYTLQAREPNRNVVARFFSAVGELMTGGEERGAISYSFDRSMPSAVDPLLEYISLDVSDSEPGDYTMVVEVEDLVTGHTVRRHVPLVIVDR